MKQAIQKAILEGGYRSRGSFYKTAEEDLEFALHDYDCPEWEEYCLDPLFWQALGKAMGWGMWKSPEINASVIEEDYWEGKTLWFYHWHRFIDHLASGGSADDFFKDLLK